MKFIITVSLALLLVIAAASSALVQANPMFRPSFFVKHEDTSAVADDEKFFDVKLYMPIRNEDIVNNQPGKAHSTDALRAIAQKHADGCVYLHKGQKPSFEDDTTDIDERLWLWRQILAPSCQQVETATKSLKKLDLLTSCERRFDHFHCEVLTAKQVRSAFKVELERLFDKTYEVNRLSATKVAENVVALPEGFSFTSNIYAGINEWQPRRHSRAIDMRTGRELLTPEQEEEQQQQRGADVNMNIPQSFYPNSTEDGNAPHIVNFGTNIPTTIDGAEASYFVTALLFDLRCEDGSQPLINYTDYSYNAYCESNTTSLPDEFEVDVIGAQSGDDKYTGTVLGSDKFTADMGNNTHCSAGSNISGFAPPSGNATAFCVFKLKKIPLAYWKPYTLRTRAKWSKSGKYSKYTYAREYGHGSWKAYATNKLFPTVAGNPSTGKFPTLDSKYLLANPTPGYAQTPRNYRAAYNVPESVPAKVDARSAAGIFEFFGGCRPNPKKPVHGGFGCGFNKTDVKTFLDRTGTPFDSSMYHYVTSGHIATDEAAAGEAQLDIQMISGVSKGKMPVVFWTVNSSTDADFGATNLKIAQMILMPETGPKMPRVTAWSESYGSCEAPPKCNTSWCDGQRKHLHRAQAQWAAVSSAGISFMVSSGDAGSNCQRGGPLELLPSLPANLPAIVGVGATAWRYSAAGKDGRHETASNTALGDLITSGGGFSSVFDVPDFQKHIYNKTVWSHPAFGVKQNARPVPDLSAMGAYILAVVGGNNISVSGTSASSPLIAALVALWNNELLLRGEDPIRNINQWVNSRPDNFWADVGAGYDNAFGSGFSTLYMNQDRAWRTTEGYDPVTGYGTPVNFTGIQASALQWAHETGKKKKGTNKTGEILGGIFGALAIIALLALVFIYFKKKPADDVPSTGAGGSAYQPAGDVQQKNQYGTTAQV